MWKWKFALCEYKSFLSFRLIFCSDHKNATFSSQNLSLRHHCATERLYQRVPRETLKRSTGFRHRVTSTPRRIRPVSKKRARIREESYGSFAVDRFACTVTGSSRFEGRRRRRRKRRRRREGGGGGRRCPAAMPSFSVRSELCVPLNIGK